MHRLYLGAPHTSEEIKTSDSIPLVKGQRIDLTKTTPNLNDISIELGWNIDKGINPSVELYRHKGEWKFAVKGEGISTGIDGLIARFN